MDFRRTAYQDPSSARASRGIDRPVGVERARLACEGCSSRASIILRFRARSRATSMRNLMLVAALLAATLAHAAPTPPQPAASAPPSVATVPAPTVAASAYLLLDTLSGQTLAVGQRRRAARSCVAHQADDRVPRLRRAAREDHRAVADGHGVAGARGRPKARACSSSRARRVIVDELLRGMIVQSGNDASIALAELVAGSEEAFVERMNARGGAARHVRTRTSSTSTGLSDPQHYSTAADLADARRRADPRLSRVLPALLAEGIPLQQHHAAEPQPAAVDRPVRRRHEDRPHRGGRAGASIASAQARRPARCSPSCSARARTRRAPRKRRSSSTGASRPSTPCSSTNRASR